MISASLGPGFCCLDGCTKERSGAGVRGARPAVLQEGGPGGGAAGGAGGRVRQPGPRGAGAGLWPHRHPVVCPGGRHWGPAGPDQHPPQGKIDHLPLRLSLWTGGRPGLRKCAICLSIPLRLGVLLWTGAHPQGASGRSLGAGRRFAARVFASIPRGHLGQAAVEG